MGDRFGYPHAVLICDFFGRLRLRVSVLFLKDAEEAFQLPHVFDESIASQLAPPILEHALDLLASAFELIAIHTSLTPRGAQPISP
jgi:hypothetical protein